MLGRPDRIKAERLNELAHVEGVIHICCVRDRRRAGVVLPQQPLPVTLVVAGHHHPTVHACAPRLTLYARCAGRPLFPVWKSHGSYPRRHTSVDRASVVGVVDAWSSATTSTPETAR